MTQNTNSLQKYATNFKLVLENMTQNTKLPFKNMSEISYHKHSDSVKPFTA